MNGRNLARAQVNKAVEEAQGAIAETAQRVREVAADTGGKAQELAMEAGRQASAVAQTAYGAAQTAYSSGNDALGLVEDIARQNIWASLLVAGAVGYGLACLVKNRS
jgi:ElaB/YqjD/DUF883 family membrane-anchored ribosome-binding protein